MYSKILQTPSNPWSLISLADRSWSTVSEKVLSGWKPFTRLAERGVVTHGRLRILTNERIYEFPDGQIKDHDDEPIVEIRVIDDSFWLRLLTTSALGFAEAYMYGEVECEDLLGVFSIFLNNAENIDNMNSKVSHLFSIPQTITSLRFLNTLSNSRNNISAHYDISDAVFQAFLSDDMSYSCAIFEDVDGDLKENGSNYPSSKVHSPVLLEDVPTSPESDPLYIAQLRKIRHLINKADIRPGHRVLEIGSGWGQLAIEAVKLTGCTVDTITLSVRQQKIAQERIHAAGLQDRIAVHLMDYRSMPPDWEGTFDRLVSVEMIEAVGKDFLETYWKIVDWALKKKDAAGVVQLTTIPEALFPGAFCPSLTILLNALQKGSKGKLVVDNVENIAPHYPRTLREWRKRFSARFESHIVPALKAEYPEVMNGEQGEDEIDVFRRKWIYYFYYCEIGFTTRILGDHIVAFAREGYMDYKYNKDK
ncbi:hypothetical protein Clacol_009455 [Clathrus columnatus]|uniref:Cyclopropane-fatty-acyl-phospholipid synthase n=1 Tax=Clathrus columnatus TaxID=1419009 RepID=A0AAV5AKM9_9AGAM|nr:hypothetical protein Clacol_009455 [Clathrus columnatus]